MQCSCCHLDKPLWEFQIDRITNDRVFRRKKCPACFAKTTREWRNNNRARHRASVMKWRAEHPELRREQGKRSRHNRREKINTWRRSYRKRKPERYKAERQRYLGRHPDIRREQKKRNNQRNRQNLGRRYVVELLRDATSRRGKPFEASPENLSNQKLKTQLWRTKHLFRALAAAPLLSKK